MQNKGFTLLLSLLVISVVLSVSLGISNIIFKQIKVARVKSNSLKAFYTADAGLECVFYWDFIEGPFSTTTQNDISCSEQPLSVNFAGGNASFNFFPSGGDACVTVNITKNDVTKRTTFRSTGLNPCSGSEYRARYSLQASAPYVE